MILNKTKGENILFLPNIYNSITLSYIKGGRGLMHLKKLVTISCSSGFQRIVVWEIPTMWERWHQ